MLWILLPFALVAPLLAGMLWAHAFDVLWTFSRSTDRAIDLERFMIRCETVVSRAFRRLLLMLHAPRRAMHDSIDSAYDWERVGWDSVYWSSDGMHETIGLGLVFCTRCLVDEYGRFRLNTWRIAQIRRAWRWVRSMQALPADVPIRRSRWAALQSVAKIRGHYGSIPYVAMGHVLFPTPDDDLPF